MSKMFDLTGKTMLVTGGNGGIGLAYARGMARQGANLILWGRNEKKNAEAVAEIAAMGVKAFAMVVDVADEAQVVAGFEEAVKRVGKIDCVIQNASISGSAPSFMELTSDQYHAQLGVALHGGFYTLREAARHMVKRAEAGDPGGSIILTGSGGAFGGIQGLEHYSAAKAGLAAMMRGMATELGRYGIRVNMITPGFVANTEMGSKVDETMTQMLASRTPMQRVGVSEDLEGAAAYLASDAARYHTGDILNIDGGWMASYF